ncbi:hypothetical protein [Ramlibacter alkalitolerans]|uniref:Uncharacterized protein n=1 Tax=Ramlibacter alkalitolerans TaxID=2039631 RepID=A0ABS1JUD2_9BURK|nr:hypothetical protein [Ramlibacter alkalitolerans]MBL0427828.1 hypothetical protein [Ramlibacter alkalitolerans]
MAVDHHLDLALATDDPREFLSELKAARCDFIKHLETDQTTAFNLLEGMLAASSCSPRRRMALEASVWPLLDKPALPQSSEDTPAQMLWLFVVPFVVVLESSALGRRLLLTDAQIDTKELLQHVQQFYPFRFDRGAAAHKLSGFTGLVRRSDLQTYGPLTLSRMFADAEANRPSGSPIAMPFVLDEAYPAGRAVTVYALCAARMPQEDMPDFDCITPELEQARACEDLAAAALERAGLPVERVSVLAPARMSACLSTCAGPALEELKEHLRLARELLGRGLAVSATVPAPGYFELHARQADGQHLAIAAPMRYIEPDVDLHQALRLACELQGLAFEGLRFPDIARTGTLH